MFVRSKNNTNFSISSKDLEDDVCLFEDYRAGYRCAACGSGDFLVRREVVSYERGFDESVVSQIGQLDDEHRVEFSLPYEEWHPSWDYVDDDDDYDEHCDKWKRALDRYNSMPDPAEDTPVHKLPVSYWGPVISDVVSCAQCNRIIEHGYSKPNKLEARIWPVEAADFCLRKVFADEKYATAWRARGWDFYELPNDDFDTVDGSDDADEEEIDE